MSLEQTCNVAPPSTAPSNGTVSFAGIDLSADALVPTLPLLSQAPLERLIPWNRVAHCYGLQLLQSQVREWWEGYLYPTVLAGLPEELRYDRKQQEAIYSNLISGFFVPHLLMAATDGDDASPGEQWVAAVAITALSLNPYTAQPFLYIWGLSSATGLPDRVWVDGFRYLSRYAQANNCTSIQAFADVDRVRDLGAILGAAKQFTLLEFPVPPKEAS